MLSILHRLNLNQYSHKDERHLLMQNMVMPRGHDWWYRPTDGSFRDCVVARSRRSLLFVSPCSCYLLQRQELTCLRQTISLCLFWENEPATDDRQPTITMAEQEALVCRFREGSGKQKAVYSSSEIAPLQSQHHLRRHCAAHRC